MALFPASEMAVFPNEAQATTGSQMSANTGVMGWWVLTLIEQVQPQHGVQPDVLPVVSLNHFWIYKL